MHVLRLQVGPLEANCWVVAARVGEPAIVIDPGGDAPVILAELAGATVSAVVLTHGHFDHLGAAAEVVAATGAPLLVHEADAARITSDEAHGTGGAMFGFDGLVAPPADRLLRDGDAVVSGDLKLTVLHTPGHTPGGICLFAEDPDGGAPHLFTGDTLFALSVGRTDFPGGDARALSTSIARKFTALPEATLVHPGHGPDSTIGREARLNPFWPRA